MLYTHRAQSYHINATEFNETLTTATPCPPFIHNMITDIMPILSKVCVCACACIVCAHACACMCVCVSMCMTLIL